MLSSVVDSVGLWSTSLTYYIIHAILVASATYWFVKRRDSAKQQSYKLTEKVGIHISTENDGEVCSKRTN